MKYLKTFLLVLVLMLLTGGGQDAAAVPVRTAHVEAQLLSEVEAIQRGRPFWVALQLKLKPNWHVYWRNAGDAGLPTTIEWQLPAGFTAGEIQWPYPERFPFGGFVNFGYSDEVNLLVKIQPPANLSPGEKVTLRAKADWLVCEEICVPESAEIPLTLPVEEMVRVNKALAPLFAETRARLPLKKSDWQIQVTLQDTLLVLLASPPQWATGELKEITFFPYDENIIHYDAPQRLQKVGNAYQLFLPLSPEREKDPQEIRGVLVSDGGWRGPGSERALEVQVKVSDELAVSPAVVNKNPEIGNLGLALAFAFVGGMILNLMPCVLPVLSLKILGFVNQAGEDRKKVFLHGLLFTAGVVVSFWILAGTLLLLRAGGEQLGWGFQLQSPAFIVTLSIFLFLFGLSLFGVFEIGTSLTTLGQSTAQSSGVLGSFLGGVLATVVATPCTAPFMGSALGFALSQPAPAAMGIFTALGLGMATPYVVLASSPRLLRFVPKPGPWMETLKQFMGFLLIATVIWLAYVLNGQVGSMGVFILLIALFFTALGGWIWGRWGSVMKGQSIRITAMVIAAVLILASMAGSIRAIDRLTPEQRLNTSVNSPGGIQWQNYSPELVQKLKQEGKPFFIDFTARWCLSCQVNKKVAFGSDAVQKAFAEKGVVAIIADWTSRDESITRALAEYGRNSVPLYVLYNGNPDSEPIILPELLTPGLVLEALEKVEGKHSQG